MEYCFMRLTLVETIRQAEVPSDEALKRSNNPVQQTLQPVTIAKE